MEHENSPDDDDPRVIAMIKKNYTIQRDARERTRPITEEEMESEETPADAVGILTHDGKVFRRQTLEGGPITGADAISTFWLARDGQVPWSDTKPLMWNRLPPDQRRQFGAYQWIVLSPEPATEEVQEQFSDTESA